MTTLVWFRDDLRLKDHPALEAATHDQDGIVALYLLDEESERTRPLGGAAKWWLHESLLKLKEALAERQVPLILRSGPAEQIIPAVVGEIGADRVVWNRRYGSERHHDTKIKAALRASGVDAQSFRGDLLFEPWSISTQKGGPYRVYSAFWRACLATPGSHEPIRMPVNIIASDRQPQSENLDSWRLQPKNPDWASGLATRWIPGEESALSTLERFLAERAGDYESKRDFPAEECCSNLSPHLRWGEISPRTVWQRAFSAGGNVGGFLSEIGWREFAKHTAYHFEDLHLNNLNPRFDAFPWRDGNEQYGLDQSAGAGYGSDGDEHVGSSLRAWQSGETGFGIVDAGMKELWSTGFMHNRVRMITASFLTKNLLIDWRVGEAWFWDTLVDADAASNPFNWQWVAGSGADAAPYFRIFNPLTQQKKFDPTGAYVERWAPESVSTPEIIDLRDSRQRALQAYDSLKF